MRPNLLKRSVVLRAENGNNACNQDDVLSCEAFELDFDLLSQNEAFDLHGVGEVALVSLGNYKDL